MTANIQYIYTYMGDTTDNQQLKTTFSKWVEDYSDSLYSWALHKTSDEKLAEDLVQETFLAAYQSYDKFRHNSKPKTWLTAILNHKIIDHYRKNARDPLYNESEFHLEISEIYQRNFTKEGRWKNETRPMDWDEDEYLLDYKEFKGILDHCMNELPADWHTAMTEKYLEQKKGKEISQDLGISSTNYWQIIHRAKLFLRECLEKLWFNK